VLTDDQLNPMPTNVQVISYTSNYNNDLGYFNWVEHRQNLLINNIPHYYTTFPPRFHKTINNSNEIDFHNYQTTNFTIKYLSKKPTYYAMSLGLPINNPPYSTSPNNPINLLCGFFKRITPRLPQLNLLRINRLKVFVTKFLQENFKPFKEIIPFPTLLKQWLDQNNTYSLKKKRRMFAIAVKITDNFTHPPKLTRRNYILRSFIKREFYPAPKPPRFINSRSDDFKIAVAPYIHAIENEVYKLPYFVKHSDVTNLPLQLIKLRKYPFILETDYTSYEGSFHPLYTDIVECQLFRHFLQHQPYVLRQILTCYMSQKNNITRPRTELLVNDSYTGTVQGTRMSGEMWTSLANGFSNLMNILFLAFEYNLNIDGFVEGDDGLFGLSNNLITPQDFSDLGFTIKMRYTRDLSDTSFCGNSFTPTTLHNMTDPEQITRLNWISDPSYFKANLRTRHQLLKSKALSMYCIAKYTPILGLLCYKIITLLKTNTLKWEHYNLWWDKQLEKQINKMNLEKCQPTEADRIYYMKRYHIDLETQLLIEQKIERATSLSELDIDYAFLKPHTIIMD